MAAEKLADKLLRLARIEAAPRLRQPKTVALATASAVAVAGSLVVNVLLVHLATSLFPSTRGFSHYKVADYVSLTLLGAIVACAAWSAVIRVSSAPRWLFLRLAVVATLVLFLPDMWLLILLHEPINEVGFLMAMHLAMALIVYNSMVRLAPARAPATPELADTPPDAQVADLDLPASGDDRVAAIFGRLAPYVGLLLGIEFLLGVSTLFVVKVGRPSGWLPPSGTDLYLAHAIVGLPLGVGALVLLSLSRRAGRSARTVAWVGLAGVGLAGVGGLLTSSHSLRLLGMGLMVVGPLLAGVGYLIPVLDRLPREMPESHEKSFVSARAGPEQTPEPINYNRNWPTHQSWPGGRSS